MKHIAVVFREVIDLKTKKVSIGGIQTYLYTLCETLVNNGYKVTLLQRGVSNLQFEHDTLNLKVYSVSKSNMLVDEFLKKNDTELDLVIWGTDSIAKKFKNIPSITIQHGIGFDFVYDEGGIKSLLLKLKLTFIYRAFQRYLAVHRFESSDYKVCVDYNFLNWYRTFKTLDRSIKVIPNFTSISPLKRVESEKIKILFARRFVAKRGVLEMVAAAKSILQKYSNVEFVFAGNGPLKDVIVKELGESERVKLTTYAASHSIEFHSGFDIAVVPTLGGEGTSLSLLEAMSAGCCVISSNVGGLTNILIDNFNGLVINPFTSDLICALERLIEDREYRVELAKNGRKAVEQGFSKKLWQGKWLQLIDEVING